MSPRRSDWKRSISRNALRPGSSRLQTVLQGLKLCGCWKRLRGQCDSKVLPCRLTLTTCVPLQYPREHVADYPSKLKLMIPFIDLASQYHSIRAEINSAVLSVLESSQFILGKEVAAFEEEFAVW